MDVLLLLLNPSVAEKISLACFWSSQIAPPSSDYYPVTSKAVLPLKKKTSVDYRTFPSHHRIQFTHRLRTAFVV